MQVPGIMEETPCMKIIQNALIYHDSYCVFVYFLMFC